MGSSAYSFCAISSLFNSDFDLLRLFAGFRPGGRPHFFCFAKRNAGKEKATLLAASLRFAAGNLRCSLRAGSRSTRFAQTDASPDPLAATLLGASKRGLFGGGQPTANSKQPAAESRQPTVGIRRPIAGSRQHATSRHGSKDGTHATAPGQPNGCSCTSPSCGWGGVQAGFLTAGGRRFAFLHSHPFVASRSAGIGRLPRLRGRRGLFETRRGEFRSRLPLPSTAEQSAQRAATAGSPFLCFVSFGEAKEMKSPAGAKPGQQHRKNKLPSPKRTALKTLLRLAPSVLAPAAAPAPAQEPAPASAPISTQTR